MKNLNNYLEDFAIDDFKDALEDGAWLAQDGMSKLEAEDLHAECKKVIGEAYGPEIEYDGDTYYLVEQAYLRNSPGEDYYQATCVKSGSPGLYHAIWSIAYPESFAEGDEDCCDWETPDSISKY